MNTFRKIKKNAKALSPVIASIILIAVTVAVSVVVAAWMGGMSLGLMGNAEQASITNVTFTSNTAATVTVQNTGGANVTINSATIPGLTVQSFAVQTGSNPIPKGTTTTFLLTLAAGSVFTNSAQYTINLLTARGNTITYTATYSP